MPMVSSLGAECARRGAPMTIEGVALYEERSLRLVASQPPAPPVPRLLTTLCAAPGPADRERAIRSQLGAIDVDWLEYGRLQSEGEILKPLSVLHTYGPPTWAAAYCSRRLWQRDTRLRHVSSRTCLPSLWTVADECSKSGEAHSRGSPANKLFETIADCGVGSGMTVCLPEPDSKRTVALHFLSRHADLHWATEAATAAALLLGVCLNEFILRHTLPVEPEGAAPATLDVPATPEMSALQTRVADCILKGFSDKEVARSLALSRHTVDYHLRALRHRFKVHNRVQLSQAIAALRQAGGWPPASGNGIDAVQAPRPSEFRSDFERMERRAVLQI